MTEENQPESAAPNDINESNLLAKIWLKPQLTLDYILKNCPGKFAIALMMLGGIERALDRASMKGMGDNQSTEHILLFAIIGGALFGWVSYYLYSFFMSLTGKWLKGTAEPSEIRTVMIWASIPIISGLILMIPKYFIFRDDLFRSKLSSYEITYFLIYLFFVIIDITLAIWSVIILVIGIKHVQNFSTGKAILNIFLPALLLVGIVLILAAVFSITRVL